MNDHSIRRSATVQDRMHEIGLVWRLYRADSIMEAFIAVEGTQYVMEIFVDGVLLTAESVVHDSPMGILAIAEARRRNLLDQGWFAQ